MKTQHSKAQTMNASKDLSLAQKFLREIDSNNMISTQHKKDDIPMRLNTARPTHNKQDARSAYTTRAQTLNQSLQENHYLKQSFLLQYNQNDLLKPKREKPQNSFKLATLEYAKQPSNKKPSRNIFQSQVCSPISTGQNLQNNLTENHIRSDAKAIIKVKSSQNTPRVAHKVNNQSIQSTIGKVEGKIMLRQKASKVVKNPEYFSLCQSQNFNPLTFKSSQLSPIQSAQKTAKIQKAKLKQVNKTSQKAKVYKQLAKKNKHSQSMHHNELQSSVFRLFNDINSKAAGNDLNFPQQQIDPVNHLKEASALQEDEEDDEIDQFFADNSFNDTKNLYTEQSDEGSSEGNDSNVSLEFEEGDRALRVKQSFSKVPKRPMLKKQKKQSRVHLIEKKAQNEISLKVELLHFRQKDAEKIKKKSLYEQTPYFYQSHKFQWPKSQVASPKNQGRNDEIRSQNTDKLFQFSPQSSAIHKPQLQYMNKIQTDYEQCGSSTQRHIQPTIQILPKSQKSSFVQQKNNNNKLKISKSKSISIQEGNQQQQQQGALSYKKHAPDQDFTMKLDKASLFIESANLIQEQRRNALIGMRPKRKIQYEVNENEDQMKEESSQLTINILKNTGGLNSNYSEQQNTIQETTSHLTKSPSFVYSVETCSKNQESTNEMKESQSNSSNPQKILEMTEIYTSDSNQQKFVEIEDIILIGAAEVQGKCYIFDNPQAELNRPTIDSVLSQSSLTNNGNFVYNAYSNDGE